MPPSSYEVPLFGTPGDTIHGWFMESVAEGQIWLKAQRPSGEWQKIMDVLAPEYAGANGVAALGQSNTGYNQVRFNYAQIRATLSNFKHAGEIVPTESDAQEYSDRAHILTSLDRNWERTTFSNLAIRDALGYALAKGTAYFYQDWDRGAWGPGRGDIRLRAMDPSDVTFIQLPKSHEIQQAYVVMIREELPLQLAKRMYASNPTFATGLRADRESPGWIAKGLERVQQFISPALRAAGSTKRGSESFPTVDIWHAYTLDGSINQTGQAKTMGAENTNWSYKVPALGDPIGQGIINPRTGEEHTLPATPDDCLLFPLRRMTVFSRTGIFYDGSSPWWHGAVPLSRLRFNDLPWEALGASQVGDATTMQDGVVALMRLIENSAAARLDPPAIYDDTRVDKAWADAFSPTRAGVRAGADLTQGQPIEFPVPPGQFDVPSWIGGPAGFIQQQEERINKITSVSDMLAVAKARQIPSADTLEKLLEMAGPIVQDMVGALVKPLTELGEWRKSYYFQFYTRSKVLRVADPDAGELLKNVEYKPEKLIPLVSNEQPDARTTRVRAMLGDYRYEVSESGLSELNRMSQTLLYVQLKKIGMPISWYSLAKVARVSNYGPPPKGTDNEQERALAEKVMEMEFQVEMAQKIQQATGQGGAPPPGGEPGAGGEGGRPPSFREPPKMVSKDGGTRSTITTS